MTAHDPHAAEVTEFRLGSPFRPYAGRQGFRDAMASLGATACVVTARRGDRLIGRTVTSVFSLSVDPPSILISIAIGSELAEAIAETYGFSFAMLAEPQRAIADAFAGRGDPEKRFDHGNWTEWPSGHPRLAGGHGLRPDRHDGNGNACAVRRRGDRRGGQPRRAAADLAPAGV